MSPKKIGIVLVQLIPIFNFGNQKILILFFGKALIADDKTVSIINSRLACLRPLVAGYELFWFCANEKLELAISRANI